MRWINWLTQYKYWAPFGQPASHGRGMMLYDVTSSYVEGQKIELADYCYNWDKKRSKQRIVLGLMTDPAGCPVSVEVFPGNIAEVSTLGAQVKKL
ncbi:MAG: hypothetical protein OXL40_09045 [Bacteroidota bacterium]|nr:hypothetical protein [Bacteroidota bacterium]